MLTGTEAYRSLLRKGKNLRCVRQLGFRHKVTVRLRAGDGQQTEERMLGMDGVNQICNEAPFLLHGHEGLLLTPAEASYSSPWEGGVHGIKLGQGSNLVKEQLAQPIQTLWITLSATVLQRRTTPAVLESSPQVRSSP